MSKTEQLLSSLVEQVTELNKRIGATGFNAFTGTETNLITGMEELSIKLKRLSQTLNSNPITLDIHKHINKIQ